MRSISYAQALSEGLCQAMERDQQIFVTGIAVDYPSGTFGSTTEATKRFGPKRVFDSPAMENALTGIAIGAAAMGKRPVIVHPRNDFMFLGFDNLINLAAKWRYMFNGRAGNGPIVVRHHRQRLGSRSYPFPELARSVGAFPWALGRDAGHPG
jgi:pyruvate dehydrogenase E1 component beta subunit